MKWAIILWTLSLAAGGLIFRSSAQPAPSSANSPNPISLQAAGIEKFFQLSDRIYSGSAPEGEKGFAALRNLGIKTIVSVDGARPEVELARRHGLHYVHLPHGYDGISSAVQLELIKVGQSAPAPIFVHCHHGTHRGPTAAAVMCMGVEGWSSGQAENWLKTVGTATNYVGLFETIRQFHPPSAEALRNAPAEFPEVGKVSNLVNLMVAIDEQWDRLKAIRKANYSTPKESPDLLPANEAVILWEHFREAQRLSESTVRGSEFLTRLQSAEMNAQQTANLLPQFAAHPTAEIQAKLNGHFDSIAQACAACHKEYRDTLKRK